jgi:hypothetical protein
VGVAAGIGASAGLANGTTRSAPGIRATDSDATLAVGDAGIGMEATNADLDETRDSCWT